MEVRRQRAAAQGMGPEVEAAVQVAPRLDGLDGGVLVYFKLAGAALLHQSEHAAPLFSASSAVFAVSFCGCLARTKFFAEIGEELEAERRDKRAVEEAFRRRPLPWRRPRSAASAANNVVVR